jgi:antitoxin component of MazEF toxin-antitoxin module
MELHLKKCGDDFIITLPREFAAQLTWGSGNVLAAEIVDQSLLIKRSKSAHDHALQIARESMDKYREVFEKLAKT